jgi:hypothetical protein
VTTDADSEDLAVLVSLQEFVTLVAQDIMDQDTLVHMMLHDY